MIRARNLLGVGFNCGKHKRTHSSLARSVDDTWESFRSKLIAKPTGKISSQEWGMVPAALENLGLQSESRLTFELIERIRSERLSCPEGKATLPTSGLLKSLKAWRESGASSESGEGSFDLPPRDVWGEMESCYDCGLFSRDIRIYGLILDSMTYHQESRSTAPYFAREILDKSILPYMDENFRINAFVFSSMQQLWANCELENAHEEADNLLKLQKEMYAKYQYEELKPTQHVYANVIHCWVKSDHPNMPKRALELLDEVREHCPELPNTVVYSLVCRAQTGPTGSPEDARAILNEMLELYSQGNVDCMPNQNTVCSVVQSFCNHNRVEEAEGFCQEVEEMSDHLKLEQIRPDKSAYTVLMNAWGKQKNPERAQTLFDGLVESHNFTLDAYIINAILYVWTKSDNPERAIELFRKFYNDQTLAPLIDIVGLNTLLHCFADHPRTKSFLDTAQKLVTEFENSPTFAKHPDEVTYQSLFLIMSKSGEEELALNMLRRLLAKPTAVKVSTRHFNSVLSGMAKSRQVSLKRANDLLREMYMCANKHDTHPDLTTFNILLHCCSLSNEPNAPWVADDLMKRLLSDEGSASQPIHPDAVSFASICDCWALSNKSMGVRRAEFWLSEMQEHLSPQEQSSAAYNSIMTAYARRFNPKEVQRIFDLCKEVLCERVNFRAYVTLLQAWSKSGNPKKTVAVLQEILFLHDSHKLDAAPNTQTFNAVLHSWLRSDCDDAAMQIEKGLEEMDRLSTRYPCQPDALSFMALLSQYTKDRRTDMGRKAVEILEHQMEECRRTDDLRLKADLRFYAEVICLVLNDNDVTVSLLEKPLRYLSNEKDLRWREQGLIALNRILAALSRSPVHRKSEMASYIMQLFIHQHGVITDRTTAKFARRCE